MTAQAPTPRVYKTIFLSDIHLGTRGCKAEMLLDFLKATESETLYLVGDIVDGWRLKKHWHWPQAHNDVIQKLLRKARKGTRVVFIPGNHDEFARDYCDTQFGDIELKRELIHEGGDGRRYLVIHGDEFDGVVMYARWLAVLGDWAYVIVLEVNHWFNLLRRRLGLPYWSVSQYLKHKVKNAVQFITKFEEGMADLASKRGVDGIICGHIHHAEIRQVGEVLYCNDGDWVESCTALVEHPDGRMEILDWTKVRDVSMVEEYRRRPKRTKGGRGTAKAPTPAEVMAQVDEGLVSRPAPGLVSTHPEADPNAHQDPNQTETEAETETGATPPPARRRARASF
ncbi:UDP-2,3-diacylglucosamine diphosphatase [Roseospira marina]|nr:UDP-2,3-diacylglucosamine diphosphatase [Roseospira marina]MBB4314163.1 UDP-2,3-diacylglucosamine pyrophosphatase LpxH [Roseospira marina]MBB5087324.1 UDP-2,3-diacylglucosamine pyrophosphatase LpxH [Roseospira marina]